MMRASTLWEEETRTTFHLFDGTWCQVTGSDLWFGNFISGSRGMGNRPPFSSYWLPARQVFGTTGSAPRSPHPAGHGASAPAHEFLALRVSTSGMAAAGFPGPIVMKIPRGGFDDARGFSL